MILTWKYLYFAVRLLISPLCTWLSLAMHEFWWLWKLWSNYSWLMVTFRDDFPLLASVSPWPWYFLEIFILILAVPCPFLASKMWQIRLVWVYTGQGMNFAHSSSVLPFFKKEKTNMNGCGSQNSMSSYGPFFSSFNLFSFTHFSFCTIF